MLRHALILSLIFSAYSVRSALITNPNGGPILAVAGDSISADAQHASDLFFLSMTNYGVGGTSITNIITQLDAIAAANAQIIIIHSGVIDTGIVDPSPWNVRLPEINALRAALTNTIIMDEVTPYTGADDARAARIRDWNVNLHAWAATNNVHVTTMHDDFGQIRVSTGYFDDLLVAYSSDGLHPNSLGYATMDTLWSNAFYNVYVPSGGVNPLLEKITNRRGGPILATIGYGFEEGLDLPFLSVTNFSYGAGLPITNLIALLPAVAACHAQVVLIHSGLQDTITGGPTNFWPNALETINQLRAGLTNSVIMDEITPYTGATDPRATGIRDWNTNLTIWAATNNVYADLIHDPLAQIRVSTGYLDDLASAYDIGDGVHFNDAGYDLLNQYWSNAFFHVYIPPPPAIAEPKVGRMILRVDDMTNLDTMTNMANIFNPEYKLTLAIDGRVPFNSTNLAVLRSLIEAGNEVATHGRYHSFYGSRFGHTNPCIILASGTDPRLTITGNNSGDSTNWTGSITVTINGVSDVRDLKTGSPSLGQLATYLNGKAIGDGTVTFTNIDTATIPTAFPSIVLEYVTNLNISAETHLHMNAEAFYQVEIVEHLANLQSWIRTGWNRNHTTNTGAGQASGISSNYTIRTHVTPFVLGNTNINYLVTNIAQYHGASCANGISSAGLTIRDARGTINRFDIPVNGAATDHDVELLASLASSHYWAQWTVHHEGFIYNGSATNVKSLLVSSNVVVSTLNGLYDIYTDPYNQWYNVYPTNVVYNYPWMKIPAVRTGYVRPP